jgi:hypothetical protein
VLVVSLDGSIAATDLQGAASISYHGAGPVEVLSFACDLARLGLMPGEQTLSSEAAPWSLLPDALGVRASDDPSSGEWRDLPAPSEGAEALLRRLPLAMENRCIASRTRWTSQAIDLGGRQGEPTFAVRVDGTHALIGATRGVFKVGVDGSFEQLRLGRERILAGFHREGEADFWFFDEAGELLRGPLDRPLEVVTSTAPVPPEAEWAVLTGAPAGEPFELFLATGPSSEDRRGLARFDGNTWSFTSSASHGDRFRAGVAWLGPGHAIAIGVDPRRNNAIVRYRDGVISSELLPGDMYGAASIAHLGELGTWIGRDNGEVDRYERGAWLDTGIGLGSFYTRTFAPLEGGLIYGTGTTQNFLGYRFAQWFPDLGVCPLEQLTDFAAFQLIALDDGALIANTTGDFDGPATPVVLTRVARARDCADTAQNSD